MLNKLKFGLKVSSGRNVRGKITSYHRGAGVKNKYRLINFYPFNYKIQVLSAEYDPNRNCFILLIATPRGFIHYILAPTIDFLPKNGFLGENEFHLINQGLLNIPLKSIKEGTFIYGIEARPGSGSVYIRSAGCFGVVIGPRFGKYILVKLPSGQFRLFLNDCKANLGIISNRSFNLRSFGKAGISRLKNRRPIVRGVAMNPVDHPHGGGEGKSSGGRPSVSPWGALTKGKVKTRKKTKKNFVIKS